MSVSPWRLVSSSRRVVSGLVACLSWRRFGDGAMPFSSSVFSPVSCHHMASEYVFVRCHHAAHCCLPLVPRAYRSCLVPLIRFDETRREAGRLLAWLSWRGSSIDVYNEYDVCDVYKRYKDTRIQEYDEYME